jgi:hypothetical protein
MRRCCAVSGTLSPQRGRGPLWAVLEICRVGESCRASTLTSCTLTELYFRLGVFYVFLGRGSDRGTREEEEFRSDNQEQGDIDGTGEVEHRDAKKCSRCRYVVVAELQTPSYGERKDDKGLCQRVA